MSLEAAANLANSGNQGSHAYAGKAANDIEHTATDSVSDGKSEIESSAKSVADAPKDVEKAATGEVSKGKKDLDSSAKSVENTPKNVENAATKEVSTGKKDVESTTKSAESVPSDVKESAESVPKDAEKSVESVPKDAEKAVTGDVARGKGGLESSADSANAVPKGAETAASKEGGKTGIDTSTGSATPGSHGVKKAGTKEVTNENPEVKAGSEAPAPGKDVVAEGAPAEKSSSHAPAKSGGSGSNETGNLVEEAASHEPDVASQPKHQTTKEGAVDGVTDEKSKKAEEPEKEEGSEKPAPASKKVEEEAAAYNKEHGFTGEGKSLIEVAEEADPSIAELHHAKALHGADELDEEGGGKSSGKSGDVQEVPEAVLHPKSDFINSGGKVGSLPGAKGA